MLQLFEAVALVDGDASADLPEELIVRGIPLTECQSQLRRLLP